MSPKDFEPLLGSGISLDTQTLTYTRTGTGLDFLVDQALKDPGLNQWASDADIKAGAQAAADLNAMIVKAIKATGAANDGTFTGADIHLMSDWIYKNNFAEFKKLHGDDEKNVETGFHLIQNDGAKLHIFGDNLINQVADSIYHIGFKTSANRLVNEDGDANARVEKVAYWLNQLMASDLSSGMLANASVTPMTQATTGTGLDQLVDIITSDEGLDRNIFAKDINDGAAAADAMNVIIIEGIKALGIANNGSFDASDVRDLSDWIVANHKAAWIKAHGDDANNVETGFHLVQNDGANTRAYSFNAVNTVADGIYHLGFGYKNGALINEDGDANASLNNVAHWLNQLLANELKGNTLKNNSVDPYPTGTTGTGLDAVVDAIVTDPGLARNYGTDALADIARDVDSLNKILVQAVTATNAFSDGSVDATDIQAIGQWIKSNALGQWKSLRGDDDAGTGVMGLVWSGGVSQIAGVNAMNSFAKAAYSLGFDQRWGGIIDEDNDWVGTSDHLAAALNIVLGPDFGASTNATTPGVTPATRSGTGLDTILDWIETDPGLINQISTADISTGSAAAAAMNQIVIDAIKATGVGNDALLDASDVYELADWIEANRKAEWLKHHGDDANKVETAFHLVQGDGAVQVAFGRNAVNTIADAIYHLGFGYKNDRLINEDGNANERVEAVAYWLNSLLANDLQSGALSNGGPAVTVTGSTGTGLDQLVQIIMDDNGLNRKLPNSEQDTGAKAADAMNDIIIQSIKATGIGNNGQITVSDVKVLSDYIKANHYQAWKTAHGDDAKNVETGFHKVQGDGGQTRLFGHAAVDTVADGIYHLGFGYKNGALINEDGNGNASLSDVAGWLEGLLSAELKDGSLSNPNQNPYVSGTTGTGLDVLVDMVTRDVGLSAKFKTDEIAQSAAAADAMNALLIKGIKATGIANDGQITVMDIIDLDTWMGRNYDAQHRQLNGNNGWDPIEVWASASPLFGANGVDEVADAIYSIGFGTKWGNSLFDENGNWTETLDNTAAWLSGLLAQDLASGALYSAANGYTNPASFSSDIVVSPADVLADGAIGALDVNHVSGLALKEGTVTFSFKLTNLPTNGKSMTLFSKDARDFGSGGHTKIYIDKDEIWVRMQSKTKSEWYKAKMDAPLQTGTTYDLALVFGSSGLKLYVDGKTAINEPTMTQDWARNTEDLVFGGSGDWRNSEHPDRLHSILDGKLTNAAIYDRALHPGEVAGLHGINTDVTGNGTTPVTPTPVDPGTSNPTPVDPTPVDPTPVDPTPVDPNPVTPTTPVNGLTLTGDDGSNKLTGGSSDDLIQAEGGNDKIDGGAGDDTIEAGAGSDFVRGGTGADTFRFGIGDGDIKIYDWEGGIDKISLTGGLKFSDLAQSTMTFNGITTVIYTTYSGERLMFRDQNPTDFDAGDFGEQSSSTSDQSGSNSGQTGGSATGSGTHQASDYDTQLTGGSGSDRQHGTSGRDWIESGGGNDKIDGKAGDDYIIAGQGSDFVRGGTGADIFQFAQGDGDIKIFDWEDGLDKIHLAGGLDFSDLTQSTTSYKGITTVVFSTDAGDRLMLRDEVASDLNAGDFI